LYTNNTLTAVAVCMSRTEAQREVQWIECYRFLKPVRRRNWLVDSAAAAGRMANKWLGGRCIIAPRSLPDFRLEADSLFLASHLNTYAVCTFACIDWQRKSSDNGHWPMQCSHEPDIIISREWSYLLPRARGEEAIISHCHWLWSCQYSMLLVHCTRSQRLSTLHLQQTFF